MEHIWTILFIVLLAALMPLHLVSLPVNWVALGLIFVWRWMHPELAVSIPFMLLLAGICLVGELVEFFAKYHGAKRYGGSTKGGWGGIIGAIVGAIAGAPFFFGFGAVVGALLGAYAGCLIIELGQDRSWPEAKRAAKGALLGNFAGLVAKFGLGIAMLVLAVPRIWPG